MKRHLKIKIITVCIFAAVLVAAAALLAGCLKSNQGGSFKYELNGDKTGYTAYFGEAMKGKINVPSSHKGKTVVAVSVYQKDNFPKITEIILSDKTKLATTLAPFQSLTAVRASAEHESLSAIDDVLFNKDATVLIGYPPAREGEKYVLSDIIIEIANGAFAGTHKIKEVVLNVNLNKIGDYAFSESSIERVTIPSGITKIGYFAFMNCGNLRSVVFEDGVKSVAYGMFNGCRNLSEISLSGSVTEIGREAFSMCESLSSITLPSGLKTIGEEAFLLCKSLTGVAIPESVDAIWTNAFASCANIGEFSVSDQNEYFKSEQGVLFSKDGTRLLAYPSASKRTFYAVPDEVTVVDVGAFSYCERLDELSLGDGLTTLSFGLCGVRLLNIGKSLSLSEENDFSFDIATLEKINVSPDNPNIKSVDGVLFSKDGKTLMRFPQAKIGPYAIPSGTEIIVRHAFYHCDKLERVAIPDGVRKIGNEAFAYCWYLERAVIPQSVTEMGFYVFVSTGVQNFTVYVIGHKSRPDGWSEGWNFNVDNVVWNYKGE